MNTRRVVQRWREFCGYHSSRDAAFGGEPNHPRVSIQFQWRNLTLPRVHWCWYQDGEGWVMVDLSDGNGDPALGTAWLVKPGPRFTRWLDWWEQTRPRPWSERNEQRAA